MADEADDDEPVAVPAETPAASTTVAAPDTPPAPPPATGAPATPAARGPALDEMIVDPAKLEATRKRLTEIQEAKMASSAAQSADMTRRLDQDQARLNDAYKATAAARPNLEPWDAGKKSAEHYTDPVEAFGSIGSVFAMLASGFAGLPMEHALNAGAAAINAIHAGDEKAYNREFESWQKNTDLAIKRHDIQRQSYNDALTLMNSNINAGRTKMELSAAQFNDKKALALLENGMDKELIDLFNSRNKAAIEMQDQWDKVQLQHDKVQDLRSDPRYTSANPAEKQQAIADWTRRWSPQGQAQLRYDFTRDFIEQRKKEKPDYTPDDMLRWRQEAAVAEGDIETGDGSGGKESTQALKSKAIRELIAKSEEEVAAGTRDKPLSITEATAEYNRKTATMSGNRADDIDRQVNQYENGIKTIDSVTKLIDKHVGAVGAAGYATRLAERVGNIAGTNSTDRAQIAHDIELLQTIAPRLLNDSSGRPLSAEAAKINRLIGGLNLGDTTANTKRALSEVRELWLKMQQDNLARRGGTPNRPNPDGTPSTTPGKPPPSSNKKPWERDPVVGGKQAAIEADTAYV